MFGYLGMLDFPQYCFFLTRVCVQRTFKGFTQKKKKKKEPHWIRTSAARAYQHECISERTLRATEDHTVRLNFNILKYKKSHHHTWINLF